jgi:phage tail-like protein
MSDDVFGAAGANAEPEINGKFIFEVDGIALGAFTMVRLPAREHAVFTDRTGADDLNLKESSGLMQPSVVRIEKVLKVGSMTDMKDIMSWFEGGSRDRRTAAAILQDRDGTELMRYTFSDAWCKKVDEVELNATEESAPVTFGFDIAVAKIEIE